MKKKIKKINLLLILLFSLTLCFCQKTIKYDYIVNGALNKDKPYLGMEAEFSTVRIYKNESQFKESRLFTGNNKDFISYKILNQAWYYESNGKWNLFFDCSNKTGGKINLLEIDYQIVFDKEVVIRNKKFYKISLHPTNISMSHRSIYFFDPSEGMTIIKTSAGNVLIRTDYFKKPLSEAEINLL